MKFSVIATTLLATLAPAAAQPVISLHGSGTTNPSKCYWTIMDQMQIQTKLPVQMTYRAVGSSTGQAEFIGDGVTSDNMFGSGDIAFSQENYDSFPPDSILHLPVVLGAISFFHSVDTGGEKLNVSPCILAKILKREITDWNDAEIAQENPNLSLKTPSPITVAHRVKGSSSTASITKYLNQVCPEEWPAELVGKTIAWPDDTIGCEGSGGMSGCIKDIEGTIGYIDMGHGHAENLNEIELLNAAQKYISSKEAAAAGGIMAAAENAALPATLEGSFADVNLLNQGGPDTWPITAMTYIYVKKDLTFIQDPASQSLLKAFLKAVYSDEYITQCEEQFGFVRVGGSLRDMALQSIDALVTDPTAPEWTFETDTIKRIGQGDYVISQKRQSYSEIEQEKIMETIGKLSDKIDAMQAVAASPVMTSDASDASNKPVATTTDSGAYLSMGGDMNTDNKAQIAIILSSVSIALWVATMIGFFVKSQIAKPSSGKDDMMESGMVVN
eukprot:CAMPEP_0116138502 /NCGR_PEP_ID=MMETSP0329-20121206/12816_1 /TAXON_ID=697910 /ORGANISM="Pseudo-nitzschia arenysensis, Strain B593" /LENGTH=499 /DNA_ID=CAMNT_0003633489 /DNA_START=141 /DNA_END=1640 /DNA_ORIENTATION=+